MHKITLVCSVHREIGNCTAQELLKILRAIEPEVLFEEIRPSDFDAYCKHGSKTLLEPQAVAQYLDIKTLRRVPVDRYHLPDKLFAFRQQIDSVFDHVHLASLEYRRLTEEGDDHVRQEGF